MKPTPYIAEWVVGLYPQRISAADVPRHRGRIVQWRPAQPAFFVILVGDTGSSDGGLYRWFCRHRINCQNEERSSGGVVGPCRIARSTRSGYRAARSAMI